MSFIYCNLSIKYFFKVLGITFCEKSNLTIRYVKKCPTDSTSLKIAAEKLNCESIEQNCSRAGQYLFQYHCVINAWRKATLEVCALNRTIIGKE